MKIRLALIVLICLSVPVFATEVQKYTLILGGNKAGFQTVEYPAPGELRAHYEFNDRGRGPSLDATIRLNETGLPVFVEVRGNDYFKGPVDEHFELKDGTARWKNSAEEGSTPVERGFYLTFNGIPLESGLLASALLRAPDRKIRLLPEGDVRLEKIQERTLQTGETKKTVTQYALHGLEFVPVQVWLDSEGRYFGVAGSWLNVIQEGWESALPEMTAAQDKFQAELSGGLAKSLTDRAPDRVVFRHANVFDSEEGVVHSDWIVVTAGKTILEAGPEGKGTVPEGFVVDATGMTLLPGLWDMHVHLGDSDGPLHLAAGVTTVRDMANDIDRLRQLSNDFDRFAAPGPHVLAAGFIDGPGPYQGPSKILADTEQEARAAVDRYAELGYVQIKIYSSIKPELVPALIDEAHKKGLRISGHIPAFMTADQVVRMGLDEIQHENFLILNFLPDVKDTRTPARFTAVAENAALLDLQSEKVRSFLALLKEKKTVIDPTINVFEAMFTDRPGVISSRFAPVADRLPAQVRRSLLGGGLPVPEGMDQRYRDSFTKMLQFLKEIYDAGITIIPGTDSLAGFAYHRELELYVQAGIPATEVLRIATIVPAHLMKKDAETGSIRHGKTADLVLVQGDPTRNIRDIRRVQYVMKDGILMKAADLQSAQGIRP